MTPELSSTERMIYTTYRANHGAVAADRWLTAYLARRTPPACPAPEQPFLISPAAPERPAAPPGGLGGSTNRPLTFPGPSDGLSAREAVADALSRDATRTALYGHEARVKLTAQAEALASGLRGAAPALEARCDRRAGVEGFHTNLVALALGAKEARGYQEAAQVTVHQSAELLAEVLGLGMATLYRYLRLLKDAGLIDYRANKSTATVDGERVTRADGTLIAVSLKLEAPARIGVYDFGSYRDLDADRKAGRTAYRYRQQLRESPKTPSSQWILKPLLIWALAPGHFHNLPLDVTLSLPGTALETILDLPSVSFSDRCTAVETAAGAIATQLADGQSVRFWCDVLWRLLRLHDQGRAMGGFGVVYHVVNRCAVDRGEGFAKRPGALAQSRLRQWAGWEELRRVAPCRVALAPRADGPQREFMAA